MTEISSFKELDAAYRAMPLWKRFLWAFDLISVPHLEEADRRLSEEYAQAVVENYARMDRVESR